MSLYRAIIVDDEQKICELIQSLGNWDEFSIQVIGQCYNGADALESIQQNRPEIVITDIRMPVYDGLELVKRCMDLGLDTNFVIISGYRQFEYAHQAMQYGVADYLLKPIDQQELNLTLGKICERLRHKQADVQEHETLKQLLREQELQKQKAFGELLWSKQALPKTVDICNDMYATSFAHDRYLSLLINVSSPELLTPGHAFIDKATAFIQKHFQPVGYDVALPSTKALTVILNFDAPQMASIYNALSHLYGALRSLMDIFGAFDLCIGVGKAVDSLQDLSLSFQGAVLCEQSKILYGWNRIIYLEDLKYNSLPQQLLSDKDMLSLRNAQESRSIPDTEVWFQQWEKRLRDNSGIHPQEFYRARDQIIEQMRQLGAASDVLRTLTARTDRAGSLTSFVYILSSACTELLAELLEKKSEQQLLPINKAKEYIEHHYSQPISLESVAEYVDLSPVYFSGLFKKSTGCNFIDYLTDIRLEAAKKLLKSSRYSIQEISSAVGYSDSKYFMKLFKKITGIKPSDYRKLSFGVEEIHYLMDILNQEREKGTSFLIIQDIPDELANISDQVILVDKGRDVKCFFKENSNLQEILHYLSKLPSQLPTFLPAASSDSPSVELTVQKEGRNIFHYSQGELIGFYDYFYSANGNPEYYLQSFIKNNQLNIFYGHSIQNDYLENGIFIPADCDQYLHNNLSIGENLLLPHYHRTHSSMGQIKKSMLDYCTRAFYQEFCFSEPYPSLEELTSLYRRLLAIYRWKMFKPQILFIEGPSIGLDLRGEQIIFEYLKKCSREGNIIFIMSNRQELLQKYCSQVVITQNTKLL